MSKLDRGWSLAESFPLVKGLLYFVLVWGLSSISHLLSEGFPRGYWEQWPELLGRCVALLAYGGLGYGAVAFINRPLAKRRAWEILAAGSTAAFFLVWLGAQSH